MTPDDARKLLGGYATGTLTAAERETLFAAALEDQALFDELAREEALRDLLRDPAARAALLAALDVAHRPWWRFWRPAAVLAMAGLAAIAVVVTRKGPHVEIVATVHRPPAAAPVTVMPAPLVPPAESKPKAPARRKTFQPPPAAPPAPAAADAVALPEAPKPEPQRVDVTAAGGVVGGVIGGAPPAVVPPPLARPMLVTPLLESAREMRFQADAAPAAAAAPPPSARAVFFGSAPQPVRVQQTALTTGAFTSRLGLRYSIVRKEGNDFVPADPAALKPGDTVAIRFTANASGYLSIAGETPVALAAMQPYTSPPIPPDRAEVRVVFARQPQKSLATPMAPLTESVGHETYVVNTMPTGALGFTIPLSRK